MTGKHGVGMDLPRWPEVDFTEFGDSESLPLSKIQSLTAGFMHRNWLSIPHVTHHDDLDVTALEDYRKRLQQENPSEKVTPLAFQIKALVQALKKFPQFNASLDQDGTTLTLKKYFNVGLAVDTPKGLLVPVIRNCDKKSIGDIAAETIALAKKARDKGLSVNDMSGGCMTITSLGGLGGTAFTPIINAPEVAILGISKMRIISQRGEGGAEWRTILPVSLSYDHRVINGADASRFVSFIGDALSNPSDL